MITPRDIRGLPLVQAKPGGPSTGVESSKRRHWNQATTDFCEECLLVEECLGQDAMEPINEETDREGIR